MWILSCLFLLFLLALYYKRTRTMSLLKRCGIPGPEPNLIFGNVLQMRNMSVVDYQKMLTKTYGEVVGFYTGAEPTILVADTDLIKNIQATDFNNFSYRPPKDFNFVYYEKDHDGSISITNGEYWKNVRRLMTPSFTPSKLKAMTPLIEDSINTFIDIIERNAETGVEFNFYALSDRLTAEVITKTAFGIENDIQMNPSTEFFKNINEFKVTKINKPLYLLVCIFPWLYPLVYQLRRQRIFSRRSVVRLYESISGILKLRTDDPNLRRKDLLQAMIDSTVETDQGKTLRLTEGEIKSNAFVLYWAGFETTSITIACVVHNLINYPEVQEKVRQEVQELYESNGKLDFNGVFTGLQYLDWVIKESLRLYPSIVSFITRQSLQDYKYKDITIPKGATVLIPNYFMQHDPKYWPNPETFDPMRFSPERKHEIIPFSFQSFGDGPRNCIGMRFADLEMKLLFAKLLLHYRLERGPNTEVGKLTTHMTLATLAPKYGVFVKATKI